MFLHFTIIYINDLHMQIVGKMKNTGKMKTSRRTHYSRIIDSSLGKIS